MTDHPIREEEFHLLALGALEAEERRALESHVAGCPPCTRKLDEARGRIALLALAAPPRLPSPAAKERLLQQIREPRRVRPAQSPERTAGFIGNWWAAVLAPAAVLLAIFTIILWKANYRLSGELRSLRAETEKLQAQVAHARAVQDLATAPDTMAVTLAPMPEMPGAQGRVLYNARQGMLLYNGNLPAPPPNMTYQLWLVPASGNPISAGVFTPRTGEKSSTMMMPLPPGVAAKAFAVTVEPAGGMPQPTGPKVLLGAAS